MIWVVVDEWAGTVEVFGPFTSYAETGEYTRVYGGITYAVQPPYELLPVGPLTE